MFSWRLSSLTVKQVKLAGRPIGKKITDGVWGYIVDKRTSPNLLNIWIPRDQQFTQFAKFQSVAVGFDPERTKKNA